MSRKTVEELDALGREICRLFQDGDPAAIPKIIKRLKKREVAFVVAFATHRLPPSTSVKFIEYLTELQAGKKVDEPKSD